MSLIKYASLSALQPIKLKYEYKRNEKTVDYLNSYSEGINAYYNPIFKDFNDFVINRGNGFILTDSITLSSMFSTENRVKNDLVYFSSIKLKPKDNYNYATVDNVTKKIVLGGTPSYFNLEVISGNQVYIKKDLGYLQISKEYPYDVSVTSTDVSNEELYLRKFYIYYNSGYMSFSVYTNQGQRFLQFGNDNILRATGVSFGADLTNIGDSKISSYLFDTENTVEDVKNSILNSDYFRNDWVTYYMSLDDKSENSTTTIKRVITNPPTHFLASFSVNGLNSVNELNINLANLKTGYTPSMANNIVDNITT